MPKKKKILILNSNNVLRQIVQDNKFYILIIIILNGFFAGTLPFISEYFKSFIDLFSNQNLKDFSYWSLFFIFLGILVRSILNITSIYFINYIGIEYVKNLRVSVFKKILVLPEHYFQKMPSGKIFTSLAYSTELIIGIFQNSLSIFLRETIVFIITIGYLAYLNWLLTISLILYIPFLVLFVFLLSNLIKKYSIRIQNSIDQINNFAKDTIQGRKIIKIFLIQKIMFNTFNKLNDYFAKNYLKLIIIGEANTSVLAFFASLILLPIFYIAINFNDTVPMTPGSISTYILLLTILLPTIRKLNQANNTLQRALISIKEINSLIHHKNESQEGTKLKSLKNQVVFKDVSFKYNPEDNLILDKVSFELNKGNLNILVGKSGGGKSSIIKLITRLYDPIQGEIYFDKQPLSQIKPDEARKHISFIDQDVIIFNETVKFNICFDDSIEDDNPKLLDAIQKADASEFIQKLEKGCSTFVGENGILLSGGQKQRIAIARAFYHEADIMIFDEATASLDNISEKNIYQSLRSIVKDKIIIVIAHRLSTIQDQDNIILLSEGQIKEIGTHKELMNQDSLYQKMLLTKN